MEMETTVQITALYNLIKLPNTVCNYFRQPLMEMVGLVLSTSCLVLSTSCLVLSIPYVVGM
jgi:hypothetical protein